MSTINRRNDLSLSDSYSYVRHDYYIVGPISVKELKHLRETRQINDDTFVRRNEEWMTYTELFNQSKQSSKKKETV
jgi:hypothetical protein